MTDTVRLFRPKDGKELVLPANQRGMIDKRIARGWVLLEPGAESPAAESPAAELVSVATPEPESDRPLVGVIMPAWNAERFIGDAIGSMLDQTLTDWELCVVDDGSDDDTLDVATTVAKELGDPRIKLHRIPHGGYAIATNAALCMATGRFIARLDADDTQHRDRLRVQVGYLLANPDCDCVTCDMTDMDVTGGMGKTRATGPMDPAKYIEGHGGPCHASVVASREVYDRVGGFSPDEEWDGDGGWNLRAIKLGLTWGHVDRPWYYHRRYPAMRSERFKNEQDAMHRDLLRAYR